MTHIQLNAAEFLRPAERGLGVAIREGQERGEIETWKEARVRAGRARHSANESDQVAEKPRPTDFAEGHEFSGVRGQGGIYAMTDGVSDEQFEEAIAEAKSEGNLSRANVARKCRCIDCRRPLHVAKSVAAQRGPKCRARRAVG